MVYENLEQFGTNLAHFALRKLLCPKQITKHTRLNRLRATEGKKYADPELQEKQITFSFTKSKKVTTVQSLSYD